MKIVWNKVTWYSKFLALIVFILTFWVAFYFGIQFQKISENYGGILYIPKGGVVSPENQPDSGNLTLRIGQDKNLGNFKIILESVVSDSRCPSDVICIWAGEVTVRAMFAYNGESVTKEMKLNGTGEVFHGFQVYVTKVTPEKESKKEINPEDYAVTFHLEK
jgi:hypothetical protein